MNIHYYYNFFEFLFFRKTKDLILFFVIIFFLSLLPYIVVAINLDYSNNEQILSFYGDGSILTLCTGILLSYYTVFLYPSNKNENTQNNGDNQISNNPYDLINVLLFVIYALVLIQFYFCQTRDRDVNMILKVFFGSILLLIFTFGVAVYLHFRDKVSFAEIQKYIDEKKEKKLSKKAKDTNKTDDGVQL